MVITSYFDLLLSRVVKVCIVLSIILLFAISHDCISRFSTSNIHFVAVFQLSLLHELIEVHIFIMCINLINKHQIARAFVGKCGQKISTSAGLTKIRAFVGKCGQKIYTSVGLTKIRAFVGKCG